MLSHWLLFVLFTQIGSDLAAYNRNGSIVLEVIVELGDVPEVTRCSREERKKCNQVVSEHQEHSAHCCEMTGVTCYSYIHLHEMSPFWRHLTLPSSGSHGHKHVEYQSPGESRLVLPLASMPWACRSASTKRLLFRSMAHSAKASLSQLHLKAQIKTGEVTKACLYPQKRSSPVPRPQSGFCSIFVF